ncbi:MAG: hypothetical protein KFF73_08305 [Cyclobacteriaceae bacterium]|nr:hypothetical protein [Cyclobacteriaceae bacterium]
MNYDEFIDSLKKKDPPEISDCLRALWHEKNNHWEKAHSIAQDIHDPDGSWIHAHLHRVEGDEWNAQYWYAKADRKKPDIPVDEEWKTLLEYFLSKPDGE